MVAEREAVLFGNGALPLFYDIVDKFLDSSAMHANDVIMMQASLQFEDSLATLEVMPGDKPRRLELCKGSIDGGQSDLFSRILQFPVDSLGSQVLTLYVFE